MPWVFSKDSLWDVYWCRFGRLQFWQCSCVDVLIYSLTVLGVALAGAKLWLSFACALLRCGPPHRLCMRGVLQMVLSSAAIGFVQSIQLMCLGANVLWTCVACTVAACASLQLLFLVQGDSPAPIKFDQLCPLWALLRSAASRSGVGCRAWLPV